MIDSRTEAALRALRRILQAASMAEKRLASITGLTPSQLLLLRELNRQYETTPSALANQLRFSQATVTNLVDRLEALGLVVRQRSDQDRRQIRIRITEKGQATLSQAPNLLQERFSGRFSRLPDWEQAMIVAMLERLGGLLDADQIDAAPLLDTGPIDR